MMISSKITRLYLTNFRHFNFKYPYPKHLQPSPPPKEAIKPENLVKIEKPLSDNDQFNREYINRNPRNLEQMLLEVKPNGFVLDSTDVVYWNKLHFEKSLKHTTARIVHNSGRTIISASTKEWAIKRHLKSTIDRNALINIARILAQRCLQSGIYFVNKDFTEQEMQTNKIQLFLRTLEEEGLKTDELSAIRPKDQRYI